MKMKILTFVFIITVVSSEQNINLKVVESPDYLLFDSSSPVKLSDFKNILLATSGFPIEKSVEWTGLKKTKALEFPRATLVFILSGNQTHESKAQSISVIPDADLEFDYLEKLNKNSDTSTKFYTNLPSEQEIDNLDCSTISSFHLFDLSESINENKINEITKKIAKLCSNDIVSYLLISDKPSRNRRQTLDNGSIVESKVTNEAVFYSDQYPAMFNLIFWTSLILGLAVFGITYGMWNMDPGLDSVIYRMTSQRIKKDQ